MINRFDKIAVDFPRPKNPSPNDAAALQELMGGKFGEMSTLMNYTFQSFNFRGKKKLRPFYDLICSIAAEEYSHIETVSYAINLLLTGSTERGKDPTTAPLEPVSGARISDHFLNSGQTVLPIDAMGRPWTGDNVFSSGNLKLDLLHNFFLECGARAGKMRVYEMTSDPCARAAVGYLLVRGGVHIVAYARALEVLTGVDLKPLFPIPDLDNSKFPEAKKLEDEGLHRIMYRWSDTDFSEIGKIWKGPHPIDGSPLTVAKEAMPQGFDPPELDEEPQLTAPGVEPEFLAEVARRLFGTDKPD
jgi:Mn-containing catalase